jgi:HlyD family secretion protein
MKPILMDMSEMSDSSEVYESRPHPFLVMFIYLVVAMALLAIIWAWLFKMDIVVKAEGTVTTKENASVVTNLHSGTIESCSVSDGQEVSKGDVLYYIEDIELDKQMYSYEEQLIENKERIEMMQAYLEWLTDNSTSLENFCNNPYYEEYNARKNIIELNLEKLELQYESELNTYGTKTEGNSGLIEYYESEVDKLLELSVGVKRRVNSFEEDETYYYAKLENYITQYNNIVKQYDDTISILQRDMADAEIEISDADTEINNAENVISKARDNINEANEKINESKTIQDGKDALGLNSEIEAEENSETDVKGETGLNDEERNESNIDNLDVSVYEETISLMQEKIVEADTKKETAQNTKKTQETLIKTKESAIETAKIEKNSALSSLETETVAGIESTILTYQQNILNLSVSQAENQTTMNNTTVNGINSDSDNLIQTEIQSVSAEITTYKLKKQEIETLLSTSEINKQQTIVTAPISGIINLAGDITEGDYITAGTQVMTIIPHDGEQYVVKSYVDNQDIAQIKEGMDVKYEVAAYPSSEYGIISGQVEFVSADLKANSENGSAYYIIESNIDDLDLYNKDGDKVELKVGMYCETKIIVDQKSVMRVLLEKINLID